MGAFALLLLLGSAGASPNRSFGDGSPGDGPTGHGPGGVHPAPASRADTARYRVVVDLRENLLHFRRGDLTLWSAPVGTGTGIRLVAENGEWDFSTPTGTWQVLFKERDPVWIAPDWYFLENDLPVPPRLDDSRHLRGVLGTAAVYFHPTLAIHGTDRPELLGQRVSHGCIRLENRYALRLYHNVQPGTEVVIVGEGRDPEAAPVVDLRGGDPARTPVGGPAPGPRPTPPPAPAAVSTSALLAALDAELALPPGRSRWDETAARVLERVGAGDQEALAGLFSRVGSLPSPEVRLEWATYLAEAYRGQTLRALETLSGLPPGLRLDAARMLVEGALALFGGAPDDPAAPWPTRRLPDSVVTPEGRPGWAALVAAERELRPGR